MTSPFEQQKKKPTAKNKKIAEAVIASVCLIGYGRVDVNIVLTCVDIYVYIIICYLSDQHQADCALKATEVCYVHVSYLCCV